jgi:hypothetical protein
MIPKFLIQFTSWIWRISNGKRCSYFQILCLPIFIWIFGALEPSFWTKSKLGQIRNLIRILIPSGPPVSPPLSPVPCRAHVASTPRVPLLCCSTRRSSQRRLPLSSRAPCATPLSHLAVAPSARSYLSTTMSSAPPFSPSSLPPSELTGNSLPHRLFIPAKTSI